MPSITRTTNLIPDGVCIVRIDEAKEGQGPKATYIDMTLTVTDHPNPEFIGKQVRNVKLFFSEKSSWKVAEFAGAVFGRQYEIGDEMTIEVSEILGESVAVNLGHETYSRPDGSTGEKNTVTKWLSLSAYAAALAVSHNPLTDLPDSSDEESAPSTPPVKDKRGLQYAND